MLLLLWLLGMHMHVLLALYACAVCGLQQAFDAHGEVGAVARHETESSTEFELTDMLGPWATSQAAWREVRTAMREGRFVTIRDALHPRLAEAIWQEMNATDRWAFRSGFEADYQFQGSSVMEPDGVHDRTVFEALNDLFDFLNAPEVKAPFAEAAGVSLDGPFQGFISRLNAGDYAAPHTDVHEYTMEQLNPEERLLFPGGYRRAVAFVCHMSKDWDASWGGDLVWTSPMTHITPRFNSLTLFPSYNDAWHMVQPVAPHAAKEGMPKRLSISGWWTTTDHDAGTRRETDLSAELCGKLDGCKRTWIGGDGTPVQTQFPDSHNPFEDEDRAVHGWRQAERAMADYDPSDPSADHFAAAMAFDAAEDHAMVAVAFGAHARHHETDAPAHMNYGIALMRSGNLDAAQVAMGKARTLAPSDPDVIENWEVLQEMTESFAATVDQQTHAR